MPDKIYTMKRAWIFLLFAARLPAQPSGISESVNVRVMDIDVVVTEKDGRPVPDLRRDEFHVRSTTSMRFKIRRSTRRTSRLCRPISS